MEISMVGSINSQQQIVQTGLIKPGKATEQVDQDVFSSVSKQSVSSLRMQANQMYEMTGNILFKQIGQAIEGQSLNMDMLKQAFQVANAQNNEQAKTLIENILNAG